MNKIIEEGVRKYAEGQSRLNGGLSMNNKLSWALIATGLAVLIFVAIREHDLFIGSLACLCAGIVWHEFTQHNV